MRVLPLSLAVAAILSFSTYADEFQFEAGAGITKLNDLEVYSLGGTYYLAPVNTSKGPLAEASFLDRQSSVSIGYLRAEDGDFQDTDGFIGGEYVFNNQRAFVNLFIRDDSANSVGGGYYLSDTWMLDGSVSFDNEFDFQSARIGTKKLIDLAGDRALSLLANYTYVEDGIDAYSTKADYYLNPNLSVGLGFNWRDDPFNFDDRTIVVDSKWFVTNDIALSAGVNFIKQDGYTDEVFRLGVSMRF